LKNEAREAMNSGIESLDRICGMFFTGVLILMAVLAILCLVRAIIGPRTADRIVSVNMMGTMVIVMIAILALLLGEGYLVDICLIYAMISFLAVIVLTKVYMGVYLEKRELESINVKGRKPAAGEFSKREPIDGEPKDREGEDAADGMQEPGTAEEEGLEVQK